MQAVIILHLLENLVIFISENQFVRKVIGYALYDRARSAYRPEGSGSSFTGVK
jgi:hypothetical protein